MALLTILNEIYDVVQKLGILDKLKTKLVKDKDKAAEKLAAVLFEINKIFTAIDQELVKYLALSFQENEDLTNDRQVLLSLEGNLLLVRVNEARGHCHKIENIYQNHLKRWFDKTLNKDENAQLEDLFFQLSNSDGNMLATLDRLVNWLGRKSQETLNTLDNSDLEAANNMVRSARMEIKADRDFIAESLALIYKLQADFVELSGVA